MQGQYKNKAVAVPATVTTGTAVDVSHLQDLEVQIIDHASAMDSTEKLMGSQDGTGWNQIGSDITAPGFYPIGPRLKMIRIDTSVAGTKRPTASVAGTETAV